MATDKTIIPAGWKPEEYERFKRIRDLSMAVVRKMDNKKGLNTARYEDLFKAFEKDPEAFRQWDVLNSDERDSSLQLFYLPFEECSIKQIVEAAKILGISLESYIYYRHGERNKHGTRTSVKVPVGYVPIKRLQQIQSRKNHYSLEMDERSLKTGDVKGESKNASVSGDQTFCLLTIGADDAIKEFMGPRGDNTQQKLQMYRSIAKDGYVSLADLHSDRSSSTTLNTINTYMLSCGLKSDLITEMNTLKTEYTLNKDLRKR